MLKRLLNILSIIYRSLSRCSLLYWAIVLLFIIAGLLSPGVMPVLSQDPTIPTRTPTPDPNSPTPTSTATQDNGGEPPPPAPTETPETGATATSTSQPGTRVTPTLTVTTSSTPTAGATPGCEDTPFVRAIEDVVNVYAGPGKDYSVIGAMMRDDVRPLVGRAEFARWWKIQFDSMTTAWIDDRDVEAYGNTSSVPLVKPPPIAGAAPTPGPKWRPTALPGCTATPTTTLSPTPTETRTPKPTERPTSVGTENGESDASDSNDAEGIIDAAAPESSELVTSTTSPLLTTYILPAAGISLIGLGLIVWLLARRRGHVTADGSDTGESSGS
jgi:hypothetical protein